MKTYKRVENCVVESDDVFERRKRDIVKEGAGFVVIVAGAYYRLLVDGNGLYYDLGISLISGEEILYKFCAGDFSVLQERQDLCDEIIKHIANNIELLDIIPNSLYLNIPNFAERLQDAVKIRLYDDYSKCSVDNIDEFLAKAEKDLKKVSAYIEKQEKGKTVLDLLTGEKKIEAVETDDKEAADYDAILDHNPTI